MPELVITSSSATSTAPPPPAMALQTPMRILKRPSASQSSSTGSVTSQNQIETLAAREARYKIARERIFGEGEGPEKDSDSSRMSKKGGEGTPKPSGAILRNPLGPSSENTKEGEGRKVVKGFKRRSTKAAGPLSQSGAQTAADSSG